MMEVLGIDIGFGFTKASNGKEEIMLKSIFGDAVDIQFHSNFSNNSHINKLHVTIDDNSYFVGDYAEQQSNVRQFTLDQDKLISDFIKILTLSAAGKFSEAEKPLGIVSGLPAGFFKENNKQVAELLTGQHRITFHNPDRTESVKNIYIKKIRLMPQPLGSFFNLLMDDNGKVVNKDLAKQKVGIIDIGFRTTDVSIFDRLQYIDRGSATMDTGIAKSFNIIAGRLQEKSGIRIELYRLYNAVETGVIKMRGQEYNISKIKDQVFSQSAETIANDIERLWSNDWDIDTIILTGGGGMALSKHLESLITGNIIPIEPDTDTRLNNVKGYMKYAKNIWGESGLCVPAKEPEKAVANYG